MDHEDPSRGVRRNIQPPLAASGGATPDDDSPPGSQSPDGESSEESEDNPADETNPEQGEGENQQENSGEPSEANSSDQKDEKSDSAYAQAEVESQISDSGQPQPSSEKGGGDKQSQSDSQGKPTSQSGKPGKPSTQSGSGENGDTDFSTESFCASLRRESRRQPKSGKGQSSAQADQDQNQAEGSTSSQSSSQGQKQNPAKEPGQGKAVVNTTSLAKLLGSDPTKEFLTADGIKTAGEISQELANSQGQARFDLKALDGSFEAKVRGQKAIVQSEKPEVIKQAVQLDSPSPETGAATSGGALGGKGDGMPELSISADIPQELVKMMPLLRGLSGEKRIELLERWTTIPPQHRVRGGPEYRLLKGISHLSALKAISQFDEVEDGAQTMSRAGEQVDLLRGLHFEAPLDELRTMEEALASGGAVDDLAEIRQKRVSTDAPNLLFVFDTSGSMGHEGRMQSAMAAAQATALYYGPKGATFGLTVFADHPAVVVPTPESDVDVVIDGILMLQPGFGTSYARGLELAIRQALPNTTIMVFGDFLDSGFPAPSVYAIAHDKNVKVVGIVSASGNPKYAVELCDEVFTVGSWNNPTAVALVALKAAQ